MWVGAICRKKEKRSVVPLKKKKERKQEKQRKKTPPFAFALALPLPASFCSVIFRGHVTPVANAVHEPSVVRLGSRCKNFGRFFVFNSINGLVTLAWVSVQSCTSLVTSRLCSFVWASVSVCDTPPFPRLERDGLQTIKLARCNSLNTKTGEIG
jgi:hypothetical protein